MMMRHSRTTEQSYILKHWLLGPKEEQISSEEYFQGYVAITFQKTEFYTETTGNIKSHIHLQCLKLNKNDTNDEIKNNKNTTTCTVSE
jgi:hypothetical protein